MDWQTLLFGFRGRINRAKYWLSMLVYVVVGLLLGLVGLVTGRVTGFQVPSRIVELVIFVSSLAVTVKRLHDRDKSAWWLLAYYLVPSILIAIALAAAFVGIDGLGGMAAGWGFLVKLAILGAFAFSLWFFVDLACLRGTKGYNRFGPDPLARR